MSILSDMFDREKAFSNSQAQNAAGMPADYNKNLWINRLASLGHALGNSRNMAQGLGNAAMMWGKIPGQMQKQQIEQLKMAQYKQQMQQSQNMQKYVDGLPAGHPYKDLYRMGGPKAVVSAMQQGFKPNQLMRIDPKTGKAVPNEAYIKLKQMIARAGAANVNVSVGDGFKPSTTIGKTALDLEKLRAIKKKYEDANRPVPKYVEQGIAGLEREISGAGVDPTKGRQVAITDRMINNYKLARRALYNPDGTVKKGVIAGAWTARNIPHGGALAPEGARFQNAMDAAVMDLLRKDTGAAITAEEISQYRDRFMPTVSDSPALVKQKMQGLEQAIKSDAYRTKYLTNIFGADRLRQLGGGATKSAPSVKEGTVIVNPKTGERRVLRNGKWVTP